MKFNSTYFLPQNVGSSEQAFDRMVIAHSTATPNASAEAIARNMYNNAPKNGAYVHYVVDDKEIYQVGEIGYKAWGCGEPGNSYGYVQIELCEFDDKNRALSAYQNYVKLISACCEKYKIPKYVDAKGMDGVKTHNWISKNLGGTDHIDPYSYLSGLGISQKQFQNDISIANNKNIVVINYVKGYGVNSYNSQGFQNPNTNRKLKHGTAWKAFGVYLINNQPMYKIGKEEFLPQKYTQYPDFIEINYDPGYGVMAYDIKGNKIPSSNRKFITGTRWKFSSVIKRGYEIFYQVSKTEFILSKFTCGGGYNAV